MNDAPDTSTETLERLLAEHDTDKPDVSDKLEAIEELTCRAIPLARALIATRRERDELREALPDLIKATGNFAEHLAQQGSRTASTLWNQCALKARALLAARRELVTAQAKEQRSANAITELMDNLDAARAENERLREAAERQKSGLSIDGAAHWARNVTERNAARTDNEKLRTVLGEIATTITRRVPVARLSADETTFECPVCLRRGREGCKPDCWSRALTLAAAEARALLSRPAEAAEGGTR